MAWCIWNERDVILQSFIIASTVIGHSNGLILFQGIVIIIVHCGGNVN